MNERVQPDVELVTELDVDAIDFGPFANPYMKSIMKKFGKRAFGRSSACAEFESFLNQIYAMSDPVEIDGFRYTGIGKTCLEIGTFYGVTAVILSQFFERVLCVSVDLEGDRQMKRRIVEHLGIENIDFFDAKDNREKAAFINAAKFDFCYQDGDHTNDTQSDFELVRRCGRVLFHEYWPLQPAVWNLVNSLPKDEVTRAKFDCLAYWDNHRGG